MPELEIADMKIEVDDDGFLVHPEQWNEKIACAIAEREDVDELTQDRMDIIRFLRRHYEQYQFFPILTTVCTNVHQEKGCMQHRFVDPLKAWKIAGLPRPSPQVIGYLHGEGGVV